MNRVELRAKVREITELTEDDASDVVIDFYARDGFERIINLERRWPFFESSNTLTLTPGDPDYPISSIGDGGLREVVSLFDNDSLYHLQLIDMGTGERTWGVTASGRPTHWSRWANTVRMWPKPSSATTLVVRGYRKPAEWWNSDATEIDCDERLHAAIVYYVISRLYQLQEDVELSNFYAQTFAESASTAKEEIMRVSAQSPIILNRGVTLPGSMF